MAVVSAARRPALLVALVALAALALLCATGASAASPAPTIYDVVSKDGSFTTLSTGLQKAGLAAAFANPNLQPRVTCFAPTDAAFNAVAKRFGVTPDVAFGNRNLLNTVINLHLLTKRLTVAQLLAAPVQDTRTPGYKLVAAPLGAKSASVSLRNIANPPAPIVKPDMGASNGIVHGIAGIMLPFKLPGTRRM
jgi:uncharacterized surface protein with fasciclin (FAS1) repeats